jgi:hypothetical protein
MTTPIHIDIYENDVWIPKDVLPIEFAQIRTTKNWRIRNNDVKLTFQEFRDYGPRGDAAFLLDAKEAILSKNFAPSFQDFINTLINGNIFLIITARGHEPNTIRKFVKWLINNYLTEEQRYIMKNNLKKFQILFNSKDATIDSYLNTCEFVGIMSQHFKNRFKIDFEKEQNVEIGKEIAIDSFLKRLNKYAIKINAKLKVGFSDDDVNTINHITNYFKEKSINSTNDYYIFNTANKRKEKVKI